MTPLSTLPKPLPLAKMAYEALRESIVSGHLQPGQIYNEMALAKDLGISRTPVREALLELSSRGLVTFHPRKGVEVNRFSERDIEEIFEVRAAIELFCIDKLTRALTPAGLARLESIVAEQGRCLKSGDLPGFMDGDRAFHLALGELVDNHRLLDILDGLRDMIQIMGLDALNTQGRPDQVLDEHRLILAAIKTEDVGAARQALESHLDVSRRAVLGRRGRTDRPTGSDQ